MLELKNISKSYGGFPALNSVSLKVAPGEIHGLIGMNGSGKSTLLNILSGQKIIGETGGFKGEIWLENKQRCFTSPGQAILSGIGMVHQEFALFPGLSVSENISLAGEKTFPWSRKLLGDDLALINRPENRANATALLMHMGIDLDPDMSAGLLSVSMKQFVEMAREINRNRLKLLLLDEPTAALGADDVKRLMTAVKGIARNGTAVLYVSHRLEEVIALCDHATVLRNGEAVGCLEAKQANIKSLSRLMVGGNVQKTIRSPVSTGKQPAIQLSAFCVEKPGDPLKGLDLTIFKNEILGVTSLSGHGRTAIGNGFMGIHPSKGSVTLYENPLQKLDPWTMIRKKIWMLPEDRRTDGLLLDHSVMDNMTFTAIHTHKTYVKKTWIPFLNFPDKKKCKAYADTHIKALDIHCRSPFQKVSELSGGNQQKVCIAAALSLQPDILFVNDPTRGVDISAKESILSLLIQAHGVNGLTLIVSSGEIDELKRICDRIAVLYKGRLFDIFSPGRDENDFILACSGISPGKSMNAAVEENP